jgi:hypothetical protein
MNGDNGDSGDQGDDKRLLPEILPAPQPAPTTATPQQRVNERARHLLQRFRSLGTTAGAAVLSLHCSYGVVDPLPPPPPQCAAVSDPFGALTVNGFLTRMSIDGGARAPTFNLDIASTREIGIGVPALRVTAGGTLISLEDHSATGPGGGTEFRAAILLDPLPAGTGTYDVQFEIDLTCGDMTATKRYHALISETGQSVSVLPL